MSGLSKVTLAGGVNAYTGPTIINAGTVSVSALANGGSPSDIGASTSASANLVLNGGTLQYTGGGANIDRQMTVGTAGGTIDASGAGALILNADKTLNLGGSGVHAITLTGIGSGTLAANITDSSASTLLTKTGTGTWILLGTNTYSGATALHNGGTLQIGNGGASGAIGSGPISLLNASPLRFNSAGTVTVNGIISGNGSITNDGTGTTILVANSTYTGDTVVNAGTLQIGNGGSTGNLGGNGAITNHGKLVFNKTGNTLYTGAGISGTGNLEIKAGTAKLLGLNDYTGWTLIDSGATFTATDNNQGNAGTLSTSVITNNGTLRLEGYITRTAMYANIVGTGKLQVGTTGGAFDSGDSTLGGTNTYTGGTFIGGAHLVLGDGTTPGAGSIVGNVTFVNNFEDANDGFKRLIFNRPDDFVFSGSITTNFTAAQTYQGIVSQSGVGMVTLTGNNNYASGTEINAGTLQVGNGGATGSIGTGPVTDNSSLIWNLSSSATFRGNITGTGTFVKTGTGELTLTSSNISVAGSITISNGTLAVAGQVATNTVAFTGAVFVEGGTLIPGGDGIVVTNLTPAGLLIDSGTLVANLNNSLAQSNTVYSGTAVSATGGKLRILNFGPALQVGAKYTIFDQPVIGGHLMTIVSPGASFSNALETDGSVTVTSVTAAPLALTTTFPSHTSVNLTWPAAWTGVFLQVQTNSLTNGLKQNWVTVPGSDAVNTYNAPISQANGAVFYRLIQ